MKTRTIRQPRCSTDPEPTAVDAIFGFGLLFVIVCCFFALWFGFPRDIIAQIEPYFHVYIWIPR